MVTARENLTVISILEQQTCKSNHINVIYFGNKSLDLSLVSLP